MAGEEKRTKAKELWQEYKDTKLMFYGNKRKAGFIRRVKNLAARISQSTMNDNEIGALMYLGHLELWLDLDLRPHFQK